MLQTNVKRIQDKERPGDTLEIVQEIEICP